MKTNVDTNTMTAIAKAVIGITVPGSYVLEGLTVEIRVPFGPDTDGESVLPSGERLVVYNTNGSDIQWELYSSNWELTEYGSVLGLSGWEPSAWRDQEEEERLMANRARWSMYDCCEDFGPHSDPWN